MEPSPNLSEHENRERAELDQLEQQGRLSPEGRLELARLSALADGAVHDIDAERAPDVSPGQLVEHVFEDIPTGAEVTQLGLVVEVTEDGAYVVPLPAGAVVPLEQLRAR
jgi:hypothetical protein